MSPVSELIYLENLTINTFLRFGGLQFKLLNIPKILDPLVVTS
jgi:hypothetical protein